MRTNKQILNSALSEINHAYQITDHGYIAHDLRIRVETITNILYSLGYDNEVISIREYMRKKLYKGITEMAKLEAFVNHYAMWDKIVYDTVHYRQIKEFYTLAHDGGSVTNNCYLCQFYELDCDECPLKTCGNASLYIKFTHYRKPSLAKAIRDIIFKEYENTIQFYKLQAYCKHYSMWDNIVDNPTDYKKIKLEYIRLKCDMPLYECYLCDYYNQSCDMCPLSSCGKKNIYQNFRTRPTTEKAIIIRDIIFKDNFI